MLSQPRALEHLRLAAEVAELDVAELALPDEHDLVVGGLRLHYLDWRMRGSSALVFLHGGALTAHSWDLVCLALRDDYQCVALDQRGHGDSEWSPILDYGPEAHVRDIRGLVRELGLTRPVLIGQSMGGLNAMAYASQTPDELAGVVFVDVAPDVNWSGAQRIRDFVIDDPGPGSVEDFVERARAFNPRRHRELLRSSLLHNLRQLPDGNWIWKYDRRRLTPEFFASAKESMDRLRGALDAITCPALVVRGAESDVVNETQAAEFAATLPDGRWATVDKSGHTVQGDNPRELARVIRVFLDEIGH
jgi:pimeloyl-ACP methyl ester carboxylesterase